MTLIPWDPKRKGNGNLYNSAHLGRGRTPNFCSCSPWSPFCLFGSSLVHGCWSNFLRVSVNQISIHPPANVKTQQHIWGRAKIREDQFGKEGFKMAKKMTKYCKNPWPLNFIPGTCNGFWIKISTHPKNINQHQHLINDLLVQNRKKKTLSPRQTPHSQRHQLLTSTLAPEDGHGHTTYI